MLTKIFSTPNTDNFFCGYYDKSVISLDNKFLLCLKVDSIKSSLHSWVDKS